MQRSACVLPALITAFGLSGCASSPKPLEPDEMGGKQRWAASDMVDASISEADRNRVDPWREPFTVATGKVWAKMFIGEPGTSPVFTITSATIRDEMIAAGFATRIHYIVEGTLSFDGRSYPIHADGARATGGAPFAAMHEAIQLGVADAAGKVRFIINGGMK